MRVQAKDLRKYHHPLPDGGVLTQGTMPEYCPKCSSWEVRVHFIPQHDWQRYDGDGGQFRVEGEHLCVTCVRCHFKWPRACHDTPQAPESLIDIAGIP